MDAINIRFNLAFAARHDEETGVWVGWCPALSLYSQGRSAEEAEEATVSAATLFIGSCFERDILHTVLREKGLKKVASDAETLEKKEYIQVEGFERITERSVPLALLSSMQEEVLCH